MVVHEQFDVSEARSRDAGGMGVAKGGVAAAGCPASTGAQPVAGKAAGSSKTSSKPAWLKRLMKPFKKNKEDKAAAVAGGCPFHFSGSSGGSSSSDSKPAF